MPEWNEPIRRRLAPLSMDAAREAEIVDELSQHLDDRFAELRSAGMSERDAERLALDELDDDEALASALRRVETPATGALTALGSEPGGRWSAFWHDFRYAVRSLRRSPGYAGTVVLTLALGIGANALIFSVVNAVLLRPLPYAHPERLVAFWLTAPEKELLEVALPPGLALVYRDRTRTMESVAAYETGGVNMIGSQGADRIDAAFVTGDFFRVLGAKPLIGRTLQREDDRPNASGVVVLGHGIWANAYGADSAIIGRTIQLSARPYVVLGVMPSGFDFPNRSQFWIPLGTDPQRFSPWGLWPIGRLKPGFTALDAQRDIATITDQFGMERRDVFPDARPGGSKVVAVPLATRLVEDVQRPLLILLAAIALVLLIACANIANLTLARATRRARELALRCCLGASPRRIAGQLFSESLVLALAGALGAILLALWGTTFVRTLTSLGVPRLQDVRVEPAVLLFAIGLGVFATILIGLIPAVRSSRVHFAEALKDGARGSSSSSRRLNSAFVVAQFAVSLVLLVGAGLVLRSFQALLSVNPGFAAKDNVLTARISLPYPLYANDTVVRRFYGQVLDRVKSLPGVRSAALNMRPPFARGNPQDNVIAEGHEPKPGEPTLVANVRMVTPGYFETIGTRLLRGRDFASSDDPAAPRVAIVDETFARRYWPHEDAVGKRFRHGAGSATDPWSIIIGVVENVKHARLDEQPSLQIYEPFAQITSWSNYLVVRSDGERDALVRAIRAQVAAIDPSVPVYEARTMKDALDASLSTRRLTNDLLSGFAVLALALCAIGVFGVVSLGVNDRVKEFGVRLALGATPEKVLGLVLRQGVVLAGIGLALGVIGALWLTRFLRGLLFGVAPNDGLTFALVTVLLVIVALAASFIPARRATRADPMDALRAE